MNIEQARFNMIEQQVRPWDVLDQRILNLLSSIPREEFVGDANRHRAFMDIELPIGDGEKILPPRMQARLAQELAVKDGDRVLQLGIGSGYITAILASLADHVFAVDNQEILKEHARRCLDSQNIDNVTLSVADACNGWADSAPYDAILMTAAVPAVPESIKQQLKAGGRLLAIVGTEDLQEAILYEKLSDGTWKESSLFDCKVPFMQNIERPSSFVF